MIESAKDLPKQTIFLKDLKNLYKSHRKKILRVALIFSLAGFFIRAAFPCKHQVVSSYFDGGEKTENNSSIENILSSISGADTGQKAAIFMGSKKMIGAIVQELGLQATVEKKRSLLSWYLLRLKENLFAEFRSKLDESNYFSLANVSVVNGGQRNFDIEFFSDVDFQVTLPSSQEFIKAKVGSDVFFKGAHFTMTATPKALKKGEVYRLKIRPFMEVVEDYRKQIVLRPSKRNMNLILMEVHHRYREVGEKILNRLMDFYSNYLVEENRQFSKKQMNYLLSRQEQLAETLEDNLLKKEKHLMHSIRDHGFAGAHFEAQTLSAPIHETLRKLEAINLELKLLEKQQDVVTYKFLDSVQNQEMAELKHRKSQVTAYRDRLDLIVSFQQKKNSDDRSLIQLEEPIFSHWSQELMTVRKQKKYLEDLLNAPFEKIQRLDFSLPEDIMTPTWKFFLENRSDFDANDFKDHIEKMLHTSKLQERYLQSVDWSNPTVSKELEGLDAQAAAQMQTEYNKETDRIQAKVLHLKHVIKQIEDPHFELSSLATVLQDPISAKTIKDLASLALVLKDASNHSEKEQQRTIKEISVHKKFLLAHLKEMMSLENIHLDLYRKKIENLQSINLQCLNEELAAINQQIIDRQNAYQEHLRMEKALLETQLSNYKMKLSQAPKRWHLEESIGIKEKIIMKMMESLTGIAETKSLSEYFSQINSHSLDQAVAWKKPNYPWLLPFTALFGFLGFIAAFLYFFFRQLQQGFALTDLSLIQSGQRVSGSIRFHVDGEKVENYYDQDLEAVRDIVYFAGSNAHQVVSLIAGSGPNFSHTLATLFAKKGYKVLLMDCSFGFPWRKKRTPGILDLIENPHQWKTQQMDGGYEFIPTGGTTRYGAETISSKSFFKLLENAKKNYDKIVLFTKASCAFAEAKEYIPLSDRIVLTIEKETMEEVEPFIQWNESQGKTNLSFVLFAKPNLEA